MDKEMWKEFMFSAAVVMLASGTVDQNAYADETAEDIIMIEEVADVSEEINEEDTVNLGEHKEGEEQIISQNCEDDITVIEAAVISESPEAVLEDSQQKVTIDAFGLTEIDGNWYYYQKNGTLKKGYLNLDDTKYYLETGAAITGFKTLNGYTYYFTPQGALTGLQLLDGVFYYLIRATKG